MIAQGYYTVLHCKVLEYFQLLPRYISFLALPNMIWCWWNGIYFYLHSLINSLYKLKFYHSLHNFSVQILQSLLESIGIVLLWKASIGSYLMFRHINMSDFINRSSRIHLWIVHEYEDALFGILPLVFVLATSWFLSRWYIADKSPSRFLKMRATRD